MRVWVELINCFSPSHQQSQSINPNQNVWMRHHPSHQSPSLASPRAVSAPAARHAVQCNAQASARKQKFPFISGGGIYVILWYCSRPGAESHRRRYGRLLLQSEESEKVWKYGDGGAVLAGLGWRVKCKMWSKYRAGVCSTAALQWRLGPDTRHSVCSTAALHRPSLSSSTGAERIKNVFCLQAPVHILP